MILYTTLQTLTDLQFSFDFAVTLPNDNWGVMSDTVLTVPVSYIL
jgi:hypothetical protein